MSDESLLPPNATAFELAVEGATCVPLPIPNQMLWNPAECPAALLPWLAHSLSVDAWETTWTEQTKRDVIATAVAVHRRKGTRAAIREVIRAAGYGEAIIVEGLGASLHDATEDHDGSITHASDATWAEYTIYLSRPITLPQAGVVRRLLAKVAPARCKLRTLNYAQVARLYDGSFFHDGTYSHGAA